MIDFNRGVRLRCVERSDLEAMRRWRNDYRIWAWCRQNTLINEQSHLAWFEWQATAADTRMFIVETEARLAVGVCGLTSIDLNNRRAEFSCYIAVEHQKNGFGIHALLTLFEHGFCDLGLNMIWGETFEGNPAFNLFNSLGMKTDGVRREHYWKDGRYVNAVLVSMSADEFKDRYAFNSRSHT